ncbi:putative arabinosyltransferase [Gordonia amarae NBRC 15530]|uniref:Putative arabinosyltransferase n=1 Tax=Gordonia amarae NBRC 15530 TaxID=1075090 RepID=G7GLN1_9ACTN|nr:putative arabinosyltransferase [Gordonia amarae NBRC 15530]
MLALATPLMPVKQTSAEIHWPSATGPVTSVSAPLTAYVPITMSATIPCAVIDHLGPDGTVLLSTTPKDAEKSAQRGLTVRKTGSSNGTSIEVVIRNVPIVAAAVADMRAQDCRAITVRATADEVSAEFVGMNGPDGKPLAGTTATRVSPTYPADERPQVTGLFTDLTGSVADLAYAPLNGVTMTRALDQAAPTADDADDLTRLDAHVVIDSRYSTSPTLLKLLVLLIGIVLTLVSLGALATLDATDGRGHRRIFPARWWRLHPRDYVVIGALLVWHMIGPNTSDDGYLLTMSRVAQDSDYTANYFRWYGAPEAPFGWYYEVFGWLSKISVASPWMRLPALACGIIVWLIVSHEILPRLGRAALTRPVVGWTAAFVFLASWFPFNNGLRPEPIICLGALLTWCSVERAIATGRLLPAALACLFGAFSLAAGPTGLLAVAAMIAGARPIITALVKRARVITGSPQPDGTAAADADGPDTEPDGKATGRTSLPAFPKPADLWSYASLLAPILAAGTFVLFVVFSDLTLRSFTDSSTMKTALGPSMHWYDEISRYTALFSYSADGSLARRFAVLAMILGLIVSAGVLIRKNRIPGTALGPSRRIVGITFASLVFLMFTPTKWTHHFGVFAGLGAALAAIAAIAASHSAMHSRRNRTLFAALVLFVGGFSFASPNSYYYYSSWGMPWGWAQTKLGPVMLHEAFLYAALVLLLVALWFHFREPFVGVDTPRRPHTDAPEPGRAALAVRRVWRSVAGAPLAYLALAIVVFELLTAVFTGINQSRSFSVPQSNLAALTGKQCAMADKIWVETDPNRDMLKPVDTTLENPLAGGPARPGTDASYGFTPDGVPEELYSVASSGSLGVLAGNAQASPDVLRSNPGGTGGGLLDTPGVNGSHTALPFGLDPATTPVLGSYSETDQVPARLTTGWYKLPDGWRDRPLLTMSVAGAFDTPEVMLEYSTTPITPGIRDDTLVKAGETTLIDPGPRPSWRNLRYETDDLPAGITAVRVHVVDDNLSDGRFVALTPPRVPQMSTLQQIVGDKDPVHLDWTSGLAFPCQRPFTHHAGVAEIPQWRIKPGADLAAAVSAWQNAFGGGPLGWLEVSQEATALATYLPGDIGRDWGALERYTPYDGVTQQAEITKRTVTRSGLWSPAPMRY